MQRRDCSSQEHEGLLDNLDSFEEKAFSRNDERIPALPPIARNKIWHLIVLIYLVITHVALGVMLWAICQNRLWESFPVQELYSPANEAVRSELRDYRIFNHDHNSVYSGWPNEKNEKAWDDLILPTYFALNESQLRAAGETVQDSVKLESGDYVAATGVYHELHCVRQLRLYLYKDVHYPNLTAPEEEYLIGHLDHCLEVLREEVMCSGDTSIVTFFWHDPPRPKPGSKSNSRRQCIEWEQFEKWSVEHMIPVGEPVQGGSSPMWTKSSDRY